MAFCAKCGNENACSSCEPGKYLMKYEGGNPDSCIDDCPDGYAKDTGNVCSSKKDYLIIYMQTYSKLINGYLFKIFLFIIFKILIIKKYSY